MNPSLCTAYMNMLCNDYILTKQRQRQITLQVKADKLKLLLPISNNFLFFIKIQKRFDKLSVTIVLL